MERFYSTGSYTYEERDWELYPPNAVQAQLPAQFGHPLAERDLWKLYERYMKRCVDYLIGRNRITFMFPTYVVKLPWTFAGFGDNDWEGSVSNDPDSSEGFVQYARTRLGYVGEIPVLFMERVQLLSYAGIAERFGKVPDWVDCVDCGQVGVNRSGKLVAYDYGLN